MSAFREPGDSPMVLKVRMTGSWGKAAEILNDTKSLKDAINYAVVQEAHQARRDIVKGITNQAPGGQQFQKLAAFTLAMRKLKGFRGTKALLVTGGLRGSITVKSMAPGKAFVGVLRSARSKDGKELFNIAKTHELGQVIVVRVTPKMRKFLMIQMRKSGIGTRTKTAGGSKKSKFVASGKGQLSSGVIVIKIPARPYMGPVIEKIASNPAALQKRLAARISKKLRLSLG